MRVAIVGSRDYPALEEVTEYVTFLYQRYSHLSIVSGRSPGGGVDIAARDAALDLEIPLTEYVPLRLPDGESYTIGRYVDGSHLEESSHGYYPNFRIAANARNMDIVKDSLKVVAFWTGESPGTKHSINHALRIHRDLEVRFP